MIERILNVSNLDTLLAKITKTINLHINISKKILATMDQLQKQHCRKIDSFGLIQWNAKSILPRLIKLSKYLYNDELLVNFRNVAISD